MTYVYKGRPHPTGLHKPLIDEIRRRRGLDKEENREAEEERNEGDDTQSH
ncbi:hypothetical protein SAMN05444358_1011711 [Ruegeria halocynthiae]|uniref:Uncharacterized protein n=1 Tax=Ruegeria halocynthiae TaxID=985054 RepID=A0A1H2W980_9RHOB|nr:hypothetical protein [Ruegeria halocynthiae]SDW77016.1 hypothetical protein SAMN05444358_1011711 [Ruegeria halocynthiae]